MRSTLMIDAALSRRAGLGRRFCGARGRPRLLGEEPTGCARDSDCART